jgi:hypothetical protein
LVVGIFILLMHKLSNFANVGGSDGFKIIWNVLLRPLQKLGGDGLSLVPFVCNQPEPIHVVYWLEQFSLLESRR